MSRGVKKGQLKTKIFFNILAVALFALVLAHCYQRLGYKHTYNLMRLDYKTAHYADIKSIEERNVIKLGMGYVYLLYIRDNTPEDAVIYLPSIEAFLMDGYSVRFCRTHFSLKLWAMRMLYPRKIVAAAEYAAQGAIPPLTHVFVVNGHGRELLDYEIPEDAHYEIYPINKEENKLCN